APTGGTAAQNLTVTPARYAFTGRFHHPGDAPTPVFAAVVLQKTQTAGGFFLVRPTTGSPRQSGAVTISTQQPSGITMTGNSRGTHGVGSDNAPTGENSSF